jgi:hypothetical protein
VETVVDTPPVGKRSVGVGREHSYRTRASNGKLHAMGVVDGRTVEARRLRDLVLSFAEPLGGFERLSEAERSLVRSAASLTVQAERLQAQAASGAAVDLEQLTRVSNAQTRILRQLGRGRPSPRSDRTPSLADYLASKAREGVDHDG